MIFLNANKVDRHQAALEELPDQEPTVLGLL